MITGALVLDNRRTTRRAASCAPRMRARARALGVGSGAAGQPRVPGRGRRALPPRHRRTPGRPSRPTPRSASSTCRPGTRRPTTTAGAQRPRLLLELDRRARRPHRPGALALPHRAPRHLGLRRRRAARALRLPGPDGPVPASRRHQDGASLLPRPPQRQAALPRRGAPGAAGRRAGRGALADAALPGAARAAPPGDAHAGRRLRLHPLGPPPLPRADRVPALRGDLHAADDSRGRSSIRAWSAGRTGAASRRRRARRVRGQHERLATYIRLVPRAEYDATVPATGPPKFGYEPQEGTPYALAAHSLLSPLGAPCNPPPWGMLAAIDLATGESAGRFRSARRAISRPSRCGCSATIGVPNLGGPITTASGLTFIGATTDRYLRAFDRRRRGALARPLADRRPRDADDLPPARGRTPVRRRRRRRHALPEHSPATRWSLRACRLIFLFTARRLVLGSWDADGCAAQVGGRQRARSHAGGVRADRVRRSRGLRLRGVLQLRHHAPPDLQRRGDQFLEWPGSIRNSRRARARRRLATACTLS